MTRRTDNDSWGVKSGVGTTATMVAAARAVASTHPDPVINDPFAAILVRAVGLELFARVVDGLIDFARIGAGWMPPFFGIRSRAIDDAVVDACSHGIRQAVIMASGLDSRAYRLAWPAGMTVYEIDQPAVINWKQSTLSGLGITAQARHRCVGIDLRRDWSAMLQQAGFDRAEPTLWIVEGLLIGYLPPAVQDDILSTITALSANGSRVTADHYAQQHHIVGEGLDHLHDNWIQIDPKIDLHGLTFAGTHHDPTVFLAERGWMTRNAGLQDLFSAAGRPLPAASELPPGADVVRLLTATRTITTSTG